MCFSSDRREYFSVHAFIGTGQVALYLYLCIPRKCQTDGDFTSTSTKLKSDASYVLAGCALGSWAWILKCTAEILGISPI